MINIPPDKRKHLDAKIVFNKQMKDPIFRKEYEKLDAEFAPIEAILDARMKKGMTQAQIAKKMGTTQSSIARVEAGKSHPTIPFLQRLADATGTRLSIRFLPQ
ncbi:MAG: helix-turn-helix transcriptional regulator [bacterium]